MMLTDAEIRELLAEPKVLRADTIKRLKKPKQIEGCRYARRTVRCQSASGKSFGITVYARLGGKFSVHVRYYPTGTRKFISLVRCNSQHGEHTNVIEKRLRQGVQVVPKGQPHIHYLTERYQERSGKALHYNEPTNEFHNLDSAIEHVCHSFGFYFKHHRYRTQHPLWEE